MEQKFSMLAWQLKTSCPTSRIIIDSCLAIKLVYNLRILQSTVEKYG